jgi:hypothetical protein
MMMLIFLCLMIMLRASLCHIGVKSSAAQQDVFVVGVQA